MEWQSSMKRIVNRVLPTSSYFLVLALSWGALLGGGLRTLSSPSPEFGSDLRSSTVEPPRWRQEPSSTSTNTTTSTKKLIELKLQSSQTPRSSVRWNELYQGDR